MYIVSQTYIGKEKSGNKNRAVLHRKTHQAHINSRRGTMPYQSQGSEKEARQTIGFSNAGVTTTGRSTTRQPAVEDQRTPGQRGSSGFQLETADGGGDTTPKPFLCPVFSRPPAGKNGHGNGTMMEAQPSEKMRLSQHLAFWICAEKSIFNDE